MRVSPFPSGVLAALTASTLLFPAVQAQTYNQTGPYYLRLTSRNATLDGQYLVACHAGAAIEGLCLAGQVQPASNNTAFQFYWNQTEYQYAQPSSEPTIGPLIWNLNFIGANDTAGVLGEPLSLQYNPGSNVAVPLFQPVDTSLSVGFNGSRLFVPVDFDDATFTPGVYPSDTQLQLEQWHACWTWVGGYYYQALAWVTAGKPHDPTCQAVGVERVAV